MADIILELETAGAQTKATRYSFSNIPKPSTYGAWLKAGLVFGTTTGAFLLAKTTGALSWIGGVFSDGNVNEFGKNGALQVVPPNSAIVIGSEQERMNGAMAKVSAVARLHDEVNLVNREPEKTVAFQELKLPMKSTPAIISQDLVARQKRLYAQEQKIEVSPYCFNEQSNPKVAIFQNGNFIIVWQKQDLHDSTAPQILFQRFSFDNNHLGNYVQVNTYVDGSQHEPSVATFTDNTFVIVWQSYGQASLTDIFGRRFDANGSPLGNPFQINTYYMDWENSPAIAALSDNKFVVVWESYGFDGGGHDGSKEGIFGQRFNSNGTPLGSEFSVNTYTIDRQMNPVVTALTNNKFVVVWISYGQDGAGYGIYAQVYDANGNKLSSELAVNTNKAGDQTIPAVSSFSDGKFIITWYSNANGAYICGRRYNSDGSPLDATEFIVESLSSSADSISIATNYGNIYGNYYLTTWSGDGYFIFGKYSPSTSVTTGNFFIDQIIGGIDTFSEASLSSVVNDKAIITWRHANKQASDSSNWCDNIYAKVLRIVQPPSLSNNQLVINEGQSLLITSSMISAIDLYIPETLTFYVSAEYSQFQVSGVEAIKFTPTQITAGQVRFVHDGSERVPSYTISVNNDYFSTSKVNGNVIFSNINTPPIIVHNRLSISKGQGVIITGAMLGARDQDTTDAVLTFTISGLQHGKFENLDNLGTSILNFNQEKVFQGKIKFTHDGSVLAPIYSVSVSDGVYTTNFEDANICFSLYSSPITVFPSVISLSSLTNLNGFKLIGEISGDNSGIAVSYAGDFNGDGISDFIVGASKASPLGKTAAGKVYVIFGNENKTAVIMELGSLNGSNGFKINGSQPNDCLGAAVNFAGDVNGDSISDLIIGAPCRQNNMGVSYIIYGKRTGLTEILADNLDSYAYDITKGAIVSGDGLADYAGNSLGFAGDINKDGIDDFVIGSYQASYNYNGNNIKDKSGKIQTIFGRRGGWKFGYIYAGSGIQADQPRGITIYGEDSYDYSAFSTHFLGDVNWDGIDDFIIGAYGADPANKEGAGKSYVVFGRKFWGWIYPDYLADLSGANGFKINGVEAGDESGFAVSSVGDINGDGINDILIGANKASSIGKPEAGISYVIFGKRGTWPVSMELSALDGSNGFKLIGESSGDNSGYSVSSAGDFNGDGISDLIIGAPFAWDGENS